MSATTSSTGGPLKKKLSAHRKYIPTCLRTVLLPFALAALLAPFTFAQSPRASGTELQEFVGIYKQLNSEKRLRVLEKDGHLVCESVDGAALIAVALVRASSGTSSKSKKPTTADNKSPSSGTVRVRSPASISLGILTCG